MSDKAIKSVRRVFEILEYFDIERRPLTANEVARHLGYPLTSAHALLKSMQELGYADYDPPNWSYTPARRLSTLLEWVNEFLDREPRLLEFIAAVNSATKETVNLSRRVGNRAKIIYGLESKHAIGVSVKVGTLMDVCRSLTGIALLSGLPDADLPGFIERLEAASTLPDQRAPDHDIINSVLTEIRDRGSVSRSDLYVQGIGAVCLPVRTNGGHETVVVGVVGPSNRINERQEQHRELLRKLCKEFGIETVAPLRKARKSA
ncbi:MAG: helix-turn-helix domain-containing protein [Pseudomonadota bacterium]